MEKEKMKILKINWIIFWCLFGTILSSICFMYGKELNRIVAIIFFITLGLLWIKIVKHFHPIDLFKNDNLWVKIYEKLYLLFLIIIPLITLFLGLILLWCI